MGAEDYCILIVSCVVLNIISRLGNHYSVLCVDLIGVQMESKNFGRTKEIISRERVKLRRPIKNLN